MGAIHSSPQQATSPPSVCTEEKGENGVITLNSHRDAIFSILVLPNDQIISGSRDYTIKLWNHEKSSWKCVRTLSGHKGSVTCLAFYPPSLLLSGSLDSSIRVWNVTSGSCVATLVCDTSVYSLCVFDEGREFAGGLDDGQIKIWGGKTKPPKFTCTTTFNAHDDGVRCIKEISAKEMFATGSYDLCVKLWNKKGDCLGILKGHIDAVLCLAVLPSGLLVSGGLTKDSTIRVWNIDTQQCVQQWKAHNDGVMSFAILPSGLLASSSMDRSIKLWDVDKQECMRTLTGHNHFVYALQQLSNGTLVSGCEDTTVKIWAPNVLSQVESHLM